MNGPVGTESQLITEVLVDGFEQVVRYDDPDAGLHAIVAIHDTARGPSLGGVRIRNYATDDDAITDVLRLAEGMTYKSALAELALGGGKCVVLAEPSAKSEELLISLARFFRSLDGLYIPGIDSGTDQEDMRTIGRAGARVSCTGRDPSPFTALGTFAAIQAAARRLNSRPGLDGVRVVVQGVGHVGRELARLLAFHGADVVVSDVRKAAVVSLVDELGVRTVGPDEAVGTSCDVFAPCALGAVIDDAALRRLDARAVVGAANNVLAEDRHGDELCRRGVLYGPDFCVNAGGVILLAEELRTADTSSIVRSVRRIGTVVGEIWDRSARENRSPHRIALDLARERLAATPDSAQ